MFLIKIFHEFQNNKVRFLKVWIIFIRYIYIYIYILSFLYHLDTCICFERFYFFYLSQFKIHCTMSILYKVLVSTKYIFYYNLLTFNVDIKVVKDLHIL